MPLSRRTRPLCQRECGLVGRVSGHTRSAEEPAMSETRIENIPQVWDDTLDVAFFGIATPLFTTEFVSGAGVLLSTYDDLDVVAVAADSAVDVPASTTSSLAPIAYTTWS